MKPILIRKRAVDLSPEEVVRCKELSYGNEGWMSEDIDAVRSAELKRRKYRYSEVFLIKDKTKIVAWALAIPVVHSPRYSACYFVDPEYRNRGFGTTLLKNTALISKKPVMVFPDDDNEGFFDKFPNSTLRM